MNYFAGWNTFRIFAASNNANKSHEKDIVDNKFDYNILRAGAGRHSAWKSAVFPL